MQLISGFCMETVEKLSAQEVEDLNDKVSVPYRVEGVTLISPGNWNDLEWTSSEIRRAVENTDFETEQERGDETPPNNALYADHEDRSVQAWLGHVENVRMENGEAVGDVVITDKQTAINLEFGAQFGISPKADGLVDQSGKMQQFEFENFSMVINPAVKTTWLNEDITAVLQDMEIHRPDFRSADERDWNSPNLEDFTDGSWDDLSRSEKQAIGNHFIISKTGFPADNYTDLALPVVEPDGTLNLNALQNAKSRVSQVSGIDEDQISRASRIINNLANGNFEDADFSEVDMERNGEMSGHKEEEDMSGHEEEMADFAYGENDKVKWDSSGGMAMGVVRNRTSNECYEAAIDGDVKVCGEQGNPAYLIEVFDDEAGELTGTMVGHKQDALESADFEMEDVNDTMVKNPMAEEETEQEPEAEESVQEESVENSDEDYVTAEELNEFKTEVVDTLKQELAGDEDEDEEVEDGDVEEAEAGSEELSEFEEFKRENPELSLSEAAEQFEQENRGVEDKLEEMADKINSLEDKLEDKEEEVEELSEKVSNPQRATQASDDGDEEDVQEQVSELSDDELHATMFKQMQDQQGTRISKEAMFE